MREEVRWWQEAGQRDLAMAERLLKSKFYEGTAFHAQQAAEKFLKALLVKYRIEFRTHSCAAMLKKLHKKLPVEKRLLTLARKLDVHYSDARYPNSVGGSPQEFYDEAIAQELLDAAKELIAYAEKGLSESD
ncbi:MAG: HEPN domain-containing protein [Candidatus Bipolaricaulota bacterium]|nr:HEPN domain-containing protein [Candidatus Bipolaricaulota bacterium]MDW8111287.1 HEPN domain-containing protein [Candidatus Bipolaricaulota bacterium]